LILGIELAQKYPWWWMFSSKYRKKMDHLIEEALVEVDLTSHRKSIAGVLSGGQLRLLELARLKLFKGNILLIDEPTAGVAPALKEQLASMIRRLTKEHGFTILVVEHDLKFLFNLVDRVIVLVDGQKYLDGDPKDIQQDERLKRVYFGSN
ncbi:MAG: ATP-binding cassette domain-containing protein, partial [Candidatus Komeilibacteria bacterium]|nr:ATP-binding cassette domain-containing protein [Candidatus Komeilibacteria bacterium]